ncbi:MAG: helix-turn-helix transcriptional regulator [Firmicutes bacterium]|nr:helix-turn-helix transcriptional regulator [Bacillota bacterium]
MTNQSAEKRSFGALIAAKRKEKGLTQQQLAERLGVTDKAVSKWECDRSLPDISLLPLLAAEFGCSVDELMQVPPAAAPKQQNLPRLIATCVALAMGVAVVVITLIGQHDEYYAMLGLGLACVSFVVLTDKDQ